MAPKPFLADFTRQIWVSAQARALWEPRIAAIGQHFAAAERASVGNFRDAALQNICPEQMPEVADRAAKIGLVAIPLRLEGTTETYAATTVARAGSDRWQYRVALTTAGKAGSFLEAWKKQDNETIGRLLGYPKCCRQFFAETWEVGSVDPTWQMADHGGDPLEANILLRWLGVRYVPHLPCGFRCRDSIADAREFRALIPGQEREWMDELLSMPMLWSSLNGIGEVVTPIVTANFRSDVHHELLEIRREIGTLYPEAGAHGLMFPYRPASARPFGRLWTDNGFSSLGAMEAGHGMILARLEEHIKAWGNAGAIIDLGAGNGELLRKIGRNRVVGIESDSRRRDRRVWEGVKLGTIQDVESVFPDQDFAVAIISVRRFGEMDAEDNTKLRSWLHRCVDHVLVYQYEQPQGIDIVAPSKLPVIMSFPWVFHSMPAVPK